MRTALAHPIILVVRISITYSIGLTKVFTIYKLFYPIAFSKGVALHIVSTDARVMFGTPELRSDKLTIIGGLR